MSTQQPNWEFVANLGDVNVADYGGFIIYRDTTGGYLNECRQITSRRKIKQIWMGYDLARRVGDRLARQIGTTSECWEYGQEVSK